MDVDVFFGHWGPEPPKKHPKTVGSLELFGGHVCRFVERAADLKKGKSIKWVQWLYVSLLWNCFVHDICGGMYNINALCHQRVYFVCISRLARPIHLWRVRISDGVSASNQGNHRMGVPEIGIPPVIIHFHRIFHELNHLPIGIPPMSEPWEPWEPGEASRIPRQVGEDSAGGASGADAKKFWCHDRPGTCAT